jgi:hypothetical protein
MTKIWKKEKKEKEKEILFLDGQSRNVCVRGKVPTLCSTELFGS